MRSALLVSSLCAVAAAQEASARPQPRWVPVDAVVATVNDSAILRSTLVLITAGRVRQIEASVGTLSPRDRVAIQREALDNEIDRHRMAQAAKSMGPITPEQVEQLLKNAFERDKQERIRDLGSLNEFSRELKRTGRTWPTYEREQRVTKLNEVAEEFAVWARLSKQQNLFLTPRMLREAYAENRGRFVREVAAKVVQVRFSGPDAKAKAEAAAAVWRNEAIDARQLASRHPGALPIGEVLASELSAELAPITTFALAGPADAVSAPVEVAGAWHVAKVTDFVTARNDRFEDPAVQQELRDFCFKRVVAEFKLQALERARQRTEVWPPQGPR